MARRAGNARIRSYADRYRCDGNDSGRTVVMPFGLRLARYRLKVCTRIPIVTSSIACAHRDDGGPPFGEGHVFSDGTRVC
jgi:hypothetical protein